MRLLAGEKQAVNSLRQENVAPKTIPVEFRAGEAEITLPGFSAAVITLP